MASNSGNSSTASSYEPNNPKSNRRFRVPSNPWLPYIGDCVALQKCLKSKDGFGWLVPKYLNALLRGISQVVFANNPLTGLVILIALFWADVFVGVGAVVAGTIAIFTALLMRQDPDTISTGLTTYNAVLVGTVTSSLWTPLYGEQLGIRMWSFIIIGAMLSVFVTSSISNILSSLKLPLPALTLPFNVVIILLFTSLMPTNFPNNNRANSTGPVALELRQTPQFSNKPIPPGVNNLGHLEDDKLIDASKKYNSISRQVRKAEDMSNQPSTDFDGVDDDDNDGKPNNDILNWGKILTGVVVSSGQVFGVYDEIGSVLIYIAIMIYSPILLMMSVFGAILGTACGIFFTPAPYEAVYTGIWGYNALLSSSSVAGFFIVLTCHSFWNAVANVVFTVLVQQTLAIAFGPAKLPVFTLPFVIATLLFLSVTTAGNHMPRVTNITFPEMHRYNYRELRRIKQAEKSTAAVDDEIAAEEKELVLTDVKVIGDDEDGGDDTEKTTTAEVEPVKTDEETKDTE